MLRRWLFLVALPFCAQAHSTTVIALVAAARDSSPVAGAEVTLVDTPRRAVTDWSGEARLTGIPPGEHRIRVRKFGFEPLEVQLMFAGDSMSPIFLLPSTGVLLDTVRAVAPMVRVNLRDFEARRQMGIGRFLTQPQLEADANREFAVVAASRIPGLEAKTDVGGKYHLVSTRSACGTSPGSSLTGASIKPIKPADASDAGTGTMSSSCTGNTCPIKVFLDGNLLQDTDFDIVRTYELGGVEYYTGASMPPQYRIPGSACGVMLLWSK